MVSDVCIKGRGTVAVDNAYSRADWKTTKSFSETLKHRKSKQFKRCFYTFPTQCMLEWRLGVAVRAYSGTPKAPSGGPLSGMGRFRNVMEVARPAQPVMVVEHTV
jgi:hypothetical protein